MLSIAKPRQAKPRKPRMSQTAVTELEFGRTKPDYSKVDFSTISEKDRKLSLLRGLQWYTIDWSAAKSSSFVSSWLSRQPYFEISKDQIQIVVTHSWNWFVSTFYGLMKMEQDGWVFSEKEIKSIQNFIFEIIEKAEIPIAQSKVNIAQGKTVVKHKSPILGELEGYLDYWVFGKPPSERNKEFAFPDNLKLPDLLAIEKWVIQKQDEFNLVKSRNDPDFVEGYNINILNLNSTLRQLQFIFDKVDSLRNSNSVKSSPVRKPRASKPIPVDRQISKLSYLERFDELNLVSIHPKNLIGAKTVILYNTKYRSVSILNSESGFTCKGTTLQGLDSETSFSQRLRKPDETLKLIQTTGVKNRILVHLKSLSTKPGIANGRINENCIILKSFR